MKNRKNEKTVKSSNSQSTLPPIAVYARVERRYFTSASRQAIVKEIDEGRLTVKQASKKFRVSCQSIYRWLNKYSVLYQTKLVKVIEHKSDNKENKSLKKELSEAYRLLGKAQAEIAFLNEVIHQAQTHYQADFKKNFTNKSSRTSTKTKPSVRKTK